MTTSLTREVEVMGTVVTLSLFDHEGLDEGACAEAFDAAADSLHWVDHVFSTYKEDSALSRLRRGEMSLGEAPPEVAEVLDACRHARESTGGWFDPWALPGGVDPSGYVKGWAAGRALAALDGAGDGALVNAAGDLVGRGTVAPGQSLRAGIVEPNDPTRLAGVITLTGALATSGTYERGAHLLNPKSRVREAAVASASVTGPDPGLADAWATALCVGGEEAFALLERCEGYEALLIMHDGSRRLSAGFELAAAPIA